MGQIQAAKGNPKQAIESLKSAINQLETIHSLHPDIASTTSALATVQGRLGDALADDGQAQKANEAYIAAARSWENTISLSPSAEYFYQAASFLVMRPRNAVPDMKVGLNYAQHAVEAAPENGFYLGALAAAQFRAGQARQALELFGRTDSMGDHDSSRDLLFRALCNQQLGHEEKARADLAEATKQIAQNRPGNLQLKRLSAEVVASLATTAAGSVQVRTPASK